LCENPGSAVVAAHDLSRIDSARVSKTPSLKAAKDEDRSEQETQEIDINKKKRINQAISESVDFVKKNGPKSEDLHELRIQDLSDWYNRLEMESLEKLEENLKDGWKEYLPEAKSKHHQECQKIFEEARAIQTEKKLEVINMTSAIEKIEKNYKEVMSGLVDKKGIEMSELKSNHDRLLAEMKETISKTVSILEKKVHFENILESKLSDEFGGYKNLIKAKMQQIREEIAKIAEKSRASYKARMQVAPKTDEDYKKHHLGVLNEEIILLRIVLRAKCPKEEQDRQLEVLKNYCEHDFEYLKVENSKAWSHQKAIKQEKQKFEPKQSKFTKRICDRGQETAEIKKIDEKKQEFERKQKTINQAVEEAFDFLKKNEPNLEQLLELNEEGLFNWYGRIGSTCMAKLEESYKDGWEVFLCEAKVRLHREFQNCFDEAKKVQTEKRVELVNKVTVHKIGLIVCDEVKKTFAAKAEQFMKENKPNWAEILLQEHLNHLIKEKCGYQSAHLQTEIKDFVIREFQKQNLFIIIHCLEKASKKYIQDMEKSFHCYICMTPEKFKTEQEKASTNAVALLFENNAVDLLWNFISHQEKLFSQRNINITEEEKKVVKYAGDQILSQYKKIMIELANSKMVDLTELKKQHDHIVNKLIEIFLKAINIVDDHGLKKLEIKRELEQKLAAEYGQYKNKIQTKIQKASEEINKMANKFRISYNENMQKAPKEDKDFEKLHTGVLNEQTILLRKILREKYPSEDQERQANILRLHCEEDFKTLKVENEKKWIALQKKEAADTIAAKEKEADERKKRREAMEKKKQEVSAIQKDAVAKNAATTVTVASSYSQKSNPASQQSRPKSILAIHFGLEYIRCGVNDGANYKYIPNEWGDWETPNVIALTELEVLIGKEVTQEVRAQNEGHVWDMGEVLSEHVFIHKEHNKKMVLMEEVVTITRELLVSLILQRMKIAAESYCRIEFNRVVITVPLWFTIVQKRSMKDAARIAGFEESFFISESTAAALCVANHESRFYTSNNLLTVVVDPWHVEAAVYSYMNGTVAMIASQGNLHCDGPESISFGRKVLKSIKHLVVAAEKPFVKLIRKVGKEQHCNEFIFISTSNIESKCLHDAAAEFAKPASNVNPVFTILLGAMQYVRELMESRASKMPLKLFKDQSPYALKFVRQNKEGSFFSQGRSIVGEAFKQDHEFEEDGDLCLSIKEDGGPQSFETGILKVPTKNNSSGLTKSKYKIKFILSFEGELTFEAQEEFDAGINKKSVQYTKTEHVFIPDGNLSEIEMTELQNFLAVYHCMTGTANEDRNAHLEEAKNNLQEYISEMEANLDKIQRPIVQNVIKNDIQAAKEMLQHEGTTIELLEKKLATLTNMKSKYF